jgi:hypothetical protein
MSSLTNEAIWPNSKKISDQSLNLGVLFVIFESKRFSDLASHFSHIV